MKNKWKYNLINWLERILKIDQVFRFKYSDCKLYTKHIEFTHDLYQDKPDDIDVELQFWFHLCKQQNELLHKKTEIKRGFQKSTYTLIIIAPKDEKPSN